MRRKRERLAAHFVARQQPRHHPGIAFAAAVEHGKRAVAQPEEAQHRRHAIARAAQGGRRRLRVGGQRIAHHHHVVIGAQQRLRRAAGMAPVGQDLVRDFRLQPLETGGEAAWRIVQAGARQRMRRGGFEARQSCRRTVRDAREHVTLLAQRHEEFRAPQHVGIGEHQAAVGEQVDQPLAEDVGTPRRLGISHVALHPLRDEIGGKHPRRLPARGGKRRQPCEPVQRFRPGRRRRRAVEDRAVLRFDGFAGEAEAAAKQRVCVLQFSRRCVMRIKHDAVGQTALEAQPVNPAPAPDSAKGGLAASPQRNHRFQQQRQARMSPPRHARQPRKRAMLAA